MKRKSPRKHVVSGYNRKGTFVHDYIRGKDSRVEKMRRASEVRRLNSDFAKYQAKYRPHYNPNLPKVKIPEEVFGSWVIDPEIYEILQLLNAQGFETKGSCQGHYNFLRSKPNRHLSKIFVSVITNKPEELKTILKPLTDSKEITIETEDMDNLFDIPDDRKVLYLNFNVDTEEDRDVLFRKTEDLLQQNMEDMSW